MVKERPDLGRKLMFKLWYEQLADRTKHARDWTFMNYGYASEAPWEEPSDEYDRRFALEVRMYDHVVSPVSLAGKDVLEVGAGRGGGASYLARTKRPKRMVGLDYSASAVGFARERHKGVLGLEFIHGDAEGPPFDDASFDVVISVEAMHCLGSIPRFLEAAMKILRPGGDLLIADFVNADHLEDRLDALREAGFSIEHHEDISKPVIRAIEARAASRRAFGETEIPEGMKAEFENFAAVEGSAVYAAFHDGRMLYFRAHARRP